MLSKAIYKKAVAELVQFDNTDVIRTSGGWAGCGAHANQNGYACAYGLTATEPPYMQCGINGWSGSN